MAKFFLTDANGNKQGPYNEQQLQSGIAKGIITPTTPLESDTGHKGLAGQIPGLFPTAPSPFAQTVQSRQSAVRTMSTPLNVEQRKERITFLTTICMGAFAVYLLVSMFFSDLLLNLVIEAGGDVPEDQAASVFIYSILNIFFWIPYLCCYYFYIFRLWEEVPREFARTTPEKAARYSFIPFFGWYWIFVALVGLYHDMNKTTEHNGLGTRFDTTLIVAACAV